MPNETTAAEREAEALGREYGRAGGSWVIDGNSSVVGLRGVIAASEAGEFFETVVPELSGPLSGEFADGYSPRRLSDELGIDEASDEFGDLCSIFEDAYYAAYEEEAVRSARASLPEVDA